LSTLRNNNVEFAKTLLGPTPVFVDVDAATFNLDPECLGAVIILTANNGQLRPATEIPADFFGQPSNYMTGLVGLF